jgi:hypothetical protein
MPDNDRATKLVSKLVEGQWIQAVGFGSLLGGLWLARSAGAFEAGSLWGIGTESWLWTGAAIAMIHQAWVWACWRLELHGSMLTRTIGRWGFEVFALVFALLGIARVAMVFVVAIADAGSIGGWSIGMRVIAIVFLVPSGYLFYSVARYFGFRRAMGLDHFDTRCRDLPLVRRGIFRFTSNGMYVFGLLLLWAPGLWLGSVAGLCLAAFNHAAIWLHYLATEKPDMRFMYGGR